MKATLTVTELAREPEAAQHEQRPLAERPASGQHAELDGGVVEVEERAHAPEPLARASSSQ